MSGNIDTREFSINDYDAAVELWNRVEGLEIAEVMIEKALLNFSRATGLSRVASMGPRLLASPYAVTMDAADISIIWRLILPIGDADSVSVCWMNAYRG
jgi:hypothetical protein